jgi:hypothetical protein
MAQELQVGAQAVQDGDHDPLTGEELSNLLRVLCAESPTVPELFPLLDSAGRAKARLSGQTSRRLPGGSEGWALPGGFLEMAVGEAIAQFAGRLPAGEPAADGWPRRGHHLDPNEAVQTHRGAKSSLRSATPALPSRWGAERCQ